MLAKPRRVSSWRMEDSELCGEITRDLGICDGDALNGHCAKRVGLESAAGDKELGARWRKGRCSLYLVKERALPVAVMIPLVLSTD